MRLTILCISLLFFHHGLLKAQNVVIPDANFKAALIAKGVDTNKDGEIQVSEAQTVTYLSLYSIEIKDQTGLEAFVHLDTLICSNTTLSTLDVSKNTALTYLDCSLNNLSSIDLTKNTALVTFYCNFNPLTTLDLSMNKALQRLNTGYCEQLNAVCVTPTQNTYAQNNPDKFTLDAAAYFSTTCGMNLTQNVSIPDSNFKKALIKLGLDIDKDKEIQVGEVQWVKFLNIRKDSITDLRGIEAFASLTQLYCDSNFLDTLDLSMNTDVVRVVCYSNQLTTINVRSNTQLTYLDCHDNLLDSLDVSKNEALAFLFCFGNSLDSLNVSQNVALNYLWSFKNPLKSLDVSKNTALTYLVCAENQLTRLDVSKNPNLSILVCPFNLLSSLDVSQNLALDYLWCSQNLLTSLDVSLNTALDSLRCDDNPALAQISLNTTQLNLTSTDATHWTKDPTARWSDACATGLDDNTLTTPKKLLKVYTITGIETNETQANEGVFIYLYSDGTREKVFRGSK